MPKTKVGHSSGRFNRKNGFVRRALAAIRGDFRGLTVLTGTEAKAREDVALEYPHWELVHLPGASGECWLSYDPEAWEKAGPIRSKVLSGGTFIRSKAYGGHRAKPVEALIVPLRNRKTGRKVVFIVAHMVTDKTALRAKIWVDDAKVLARIVRGIRLGNRKRGHDVDFVVNADWNKNFRQAKERWMIQHHFAGPARLHQAWAGHTPKRGGTHGPRGLIDGTVTSLKVRGARLVKRTKIQKQASDHNPYVVTLEV